MVAARTRVRAVWYSFRKVMFEFSKKLVKMPTLKLAALADQTYASACTQNTPISQNVIQSTEVFIAPIVPNHAAFETIGNKPTSLTELMSLLITGSVEHG